MPLKQDHLKLAQNGFGIFVSQTLSSQGTFNCDLQTHKQLCLKKVKK